VKSELIPGDPDLKSEGSKSGNDDVEHCEGKEANTCCDTCQASGIGPNEQEVMAKTGARPILSAEIKAEIIEYVQAFAVAIVIAAFIITFIAQSFVVEGSSMEPSLHNRERLLVNKLVYRLRKPERGEIVVFRYPANPKRRFIKRVIGVPGDEVEVRDGFVILNGIALNEDYTMDLTYGYFGPKTVPNGHYFVLGDNRNNSDDSRYPDVGFVPIANIVGKASLIWWPPGRICLIRNPEAHLVKP
jgi:signal peptidase I